MKIVEGDVLSMFGLTAQSQVAELAGAVLAGDAQGALRDLNRLASSGKELGRLIADLLAHFRNVLLFQVSNGDLSLLEVSEAQAAALKAQAQVADSSVLNRILEVLADAELRFRDTVSRKILLEVTLMKAIEARNAVSIDTLLRTLNGLRSGQPAAPAPSAARAPSASLSRPAPVLSSPPASAAPPAEPSGSREPNLEALWSQLLEAVARVSKFAHTYLVQAHPVSLSKNLLTIGFDPEFEDQMGLADNSKTHDLLQTRLAELGHPGTMVKFVKAEVAVRPKPLSPPPPENPPATLPPVAVPLPPREGSPKAPDRAAKKPAAPSLSKEDFKNDPLIAKALEVFKGQIVDVRG